MPRIVNLCTICGKRLDLIASFPIDGTSVMNEYRCGHSFVESASAIKTDSAALTYTSIDGSKQARGYQEEGIRFALAQGEYAQYAHRGVSCIIADQMRLGKTPQSLLALRNVYSAYNPCLILVRSANLYQWLREYKTWTDALPLGIYPILGTKAWIPPGFHTYIMSMDTFSRSGTCKNCKHAMQGHEEDSGKCRNKKCECRAPEANGDSMVDKLLAFGFKLVICDEAHSFKNADSNRSRALIKFIHDISETELRRELAFRCVYCSHNWEETITVKVNVHTGQSDSTSTHYTKCPKCGAGIGQSQVKHEKHARKCDVIMLTGTPIKNRADEYFVPLNLVAPQVFTSLDRFRRNWLTQDEKGRWSRVHPYRLQAFKEAIAPYVLRREKEDVYADTPPLNRMYSVIQIEDEHLKKLYNAELDKIAVKMDNGESKWSDLQDNLMFLRRICGMAKVKWAADYAEQALEVDDILTDNKATTKLAIGIHHKDVRDALLREIGDWRCETLDGTDSAEEKYRVMTRFETNTKRVLVMNMLAGGVGMDFHYVDNVLVLERQWSSADEEQFEFRFYNPDKSIKNRPTNIEYVIAEGTIDNWWYDMVQAKREIFGETIANNWDVRSDPGSFAELMEKTIAARL